MRHVEISCTFASLGTKKGLSKICSRMAFSLDLKRVLISDSVDSCCKTVLEANGISVALKTKLTKEELLAEISVSFAL